MSGRFGVRRCLPDSREQTLAEEKRDSDGGDEWEASGGSAG